MKVLIDKAFSNWILGAIIRDSITYSESVIQLEYLENSPKKLVGVYKFLYFMFLGVPENNLIVNQNTYFALCKNSRLSKKQRNKARVFFTHAELNNLHHKKLDYLLDAAEIIVMNRNQKQILVNAGFDQCKISISYGAVNPEVFHVEKNEIENEYVFISGDVKERKCPRKILSLIKEYSSIEFVVFGSQWREYILQSGETPINVKFAGTSLSDSAYFMRNASCYLTLAKLEGGPYGTIEALASGTPVVCTPTGWNPEVIDTSNGVLVSFDASLEAIANAIRCAFVLKRQLIKPSLKHPNFDFFQQAQVLFKEHPLD